LIFCELAIFLISWSFFLLARLMTCLFFTTHVVVLFLLSYSA
jgi:hypothetical protein